MTVVTKQQGDMNDCQLGRLVDFIEPLNISVTDNQNNTYTHSNCLVLAIPILKLSIVFKNPGMLSVLICYSDDANEHYSV